ncbi:putative hemicentin-1-like [Apostichopus japonicus]|uniref:Putative hemicentin-1-like n=1 Tax=Stichopus japonicus TaxID=307972 RepID=A0A2G8JCJ5_STIJA|nr:putative hemicentin-1-like [Apostichopus japonicus]
MSVSAIKLALERSLPGSQIYVFTDARAKDYNKTKDVLKLIQDKESQVVFVLTGDCDNSAHEGYTAYEQIAAASSGQVFHLNKSDVEEVLKFVELSVQTSKVHLISTDMSQGAVQYHWLPVDTRLQQFIISLSGDNPNIMLRAPNVHCAGKIGPLTRFTPISWSKVIASAEEWCKLSGPQCDVAHKVLSTCKEQPDSFEDIFYHRDCYAAFTNKTDIIRAKKRQMKLPQHKAVEDLDTSIEDHQTEIDEPLEKQLL